MTAKERGDLGESLAARLLEQKGFTVLERNFHCRYGEIDIICQNRETIVFAEVKARGKNMLGQPAEAVTAGKQRKIIFTATRFLQKNPSPLQPRFDVLEVFLDETPPKIRHIPNAFSV